MERSTNEAIACFNAKTGDVEDAPALDALPVFKVSQRDGAVYISGEESAIKGSRRTPNFKCSKSASTQDNKVIVVGGGSGALGAVEGLREKGFKGPITIISNEGYLPVDRTKLSKALIADAEKLAWRDKAWYESGNVEWVDGEVTGVDFGEKKVSTKDGGSHSYSKLVLASGGTARQLPLQGFRVLGNIFTLRNVHDTKKITAAIGDKGKKIVVVGSSFIGLEAACATAKDNDVTVIGMEKVPLQRVLGEEVGGGLQKFIEAKGVKFVMEASVDKAEPSNSEPSNVGAVYLKDGTKLEADLVILGIGVSPATEYLKNNNAINLEEDGSINTDENFSVAGVKDVYAIGDIATYPYHGPGGDGKATRIEHWNVAQNGGRVAAGHIVSSSSGGSSAPVTSGTVDKLHFMPVFWSALGAQMRYCGNTPNGWDDLVLSGKPDEGKFVAYYTKGETVVAMASMGMDPAMVQSAELMKRGKMLGKSQLKESNVDVMSVGVPA